MSIKTSETKDKEDKKDKKERFGKSTKSIEVEKVFEDFQEDIHPEIKEEILLRLGSVYRDKLEVFKEDYHRYAQTGRFVTSTYTRKIKRRDLVCFINLETDLLIIERVQWCDGVTVKSKSYEYPVSLIKTIEVRTTPIINIRNKIVIHLAIANTYSLDITNKLRDLADSVFMKSILRYQDKKFAEKPITQIIIAGVVFGLVLYIALIQVFKKAILKMIGQMTLVPPES